MFIILGRREFYRMFSNEEEGRKNGYLLNHRLSEETVKDVMDTEISIDESYEGNLKDIRDHLLRED